MENVTVSLEWQSKLTQGFNNTFEYLISYSINIKPSIGARISKIDANRVNLTVPYNIPYNVSIFAVFCDQMNTHRSTIYKLIYGEYVLFHTHVYHYKTSIDGDVYIYLLII